MQCTVVSAFRSIAAFFLQVKAEAKRRALKMKFHGAKDHLDKSMHEYKVCAARLGTVVWNPGLQGPLAVLAAAVYLKASACGRRSSSAFRWSSDQLAPCRCGYIWPVVWNPSAQRICDDLVHYD